MKNFTLFGMLISILTLSAQDYKPLLDNFNEWHLTSCYNGCNTDIYYTNGDTLVDNKTYKILDGFHYISRTFLIRENVETKKVYMKLATRENNPEYLLYDFALNTGDSIDIKNPITPFPSDAGFYTVDSIIPHPLEDGNYYRHFYLSPSASNTISNTPTTWVEGVGSLSLINAPGGFPDINAAGQLSCFFKNAELFYSNMDSISKCEPLILNIKNEEQLADLKMNTLVKNGICEMYNTQNLKSATLFDLQGKKLFAVEPKGASNYSLDFSEYASGMYLVVALSKDFTRKVFKVVIK